MAIGTLNKQGNWMVEDFHMMRETVYYHMKLDVNWIKYWTDQDANYFGVWVNYDTLQVLTFAEGDEFVVSCANIRQFQKEMLSMDKFYRGVD